MRWLAALCLLCGLAHADPHSATLRAAARPGGAGAIDRGEPRVGYKSGRPLRIRVVDVNGAEVEIKTARAFEAMRAAAERDGIRLHVWSGFRTNERQAELYARWRAHDGNLAAKPGFSNHQSGQALDLALQLDGAYAWLEQHARSYGFRRTVASEPWHWEFVGVPRRTTTMARKSKR